MTNSTKIIIGVVGILVIGGVIVFSSNKQQDQEPPIEKANTVIQGEQIPILESMHIPNGEIVSDYNSNPPTSGKHYGVQADWGMYDSPLPDELVVHNLEHGGIWISYKDIDEETKGQIENIANKYNQAMIVTPRPENDSSLAIASWGRLLKLDTFDGERIENFVQANVNNSPEKFASLEKAKIVIGKKAPDAAFVTLGGEELSLSEFKGQKVMFWLFATWCPSCIAGAQVMEKSNDELGNLKIIALETDGNAGFPGPTVEEFARENAPEMLSISNWLWGEASVEASKTYNPRDFPDIYFLVDEEGVIRAIDTAPAATIKKIINFANE